MKTTFMVLCVILLASSLVVVGFGIGVLAERNRPKPPPEPVKHEHIYHLDRSECKKPV